MITEDALVVLEQIAAKPSHGAARGISKALGFGRDKTQALINELRNNGLVKTTTYKTSLNSFGKVLQPTEAGYHVLKIRTSIQQSMQNSSLLLNAYSFISKKEYFRERKEEQMYEEEYESAPMYLEPEERAEYLRKAREKRDAKYREERDAQVAAKIKEKSERTPDKWTTDDSAHYFAERVAGMWNVEPWTTVRTAFKAAFGKARKSYGTTGDIELKMMERFFENLEHKKHITNPEVIWKVFIRDFGALLTAVERSNVTQEDIDKAEEILKRQWEKYRV